MVCAFPLVSLGLLYVHFFHSDSVEECIFDISLFGLAISGGGCDERKDDLK